MSKMDRQLLRQKIRQRISVIPENWRFNSRFVLKTTKTPVFVFITDILWQTFRRNKWQSVFDIVKDSSFWAQIMHGRDGVLLVQKSMDTSQYFQSTMIFLSLKSHNCDISKLWWWKIEIINPFGYII